MEREICPGCKQEIDPDWCWCGDKIDHDAFEAGHTGIPMGCVWMRRDARQRSMRGLWQAGSIPARQKPSAAHRTDNAVLDASITSRPNTPLASGKYSARTPTPALVSQFHPAARTEQRV